MILAEKTVYLTGPGATGPWWFELLLGAVRAAAKETHSSPP
jgi:hypothetical protein